MSWVMRCVRDGGIAATAAVVALGANAQPAATPAAAQQPIVVQGFECRSDDPAWRLDANRASAQFDLTTAKGKARSGVPGALQPLAQAPQLVVWRGDTTHLPRETMVVTVREEACRGTATQPRGAVGEGPVKR